jgi:hypothetical protein
MKTIARGRILTLAALLGLCACSTITVKTEDGVTTVRRQFGALWVNLPPAERSLTSVKAFGVLSTPLGVGVGFSSADVAALPAECRLVIWVRNEAEVSNIKRALAPALKEGLCVEPQL